MAVLVPTTRLPNKTVENRQDRRYPVARQTFTTVVLDGTNTITISGVDLNGFFVEYFIASPAIPTDAVFVLSLVDEGAFTAYTKTDLADDTTERQDVVSNNLYLVGKYDITISFATNLSGNTATFDLWINLVNR